VSSIVALGLRIVSEEQSQWTGFNCMMYIGSPKSALITPIITRCIVYAASHRANFFHFQKDDVFADALHSAIAQTSHIQKPKSSDPEGHEMRTGAHSSIIITLTDLAAGGSLF
jgi:hypothetical protein